MNTTRKGNEKELRTMELLEAEGWTVASRRHLAGPGDVLATKPGVRPRLIEVKATKIPYQNFKRPDRDALRDYAAAHSLVAELAWWKPRAKTHVVLIEAEWP